MRIHTDLRILLITFGVVSILPIFLHGNLPVMHTLIMCLIWAVVAASWDLIMGYAGVFTFANVALFAIGGYTTGILTSQLGISPWLGMLTGGVMAAVVGVVIAFPCLRLKGSYIALITFALHLILGPFLKSGLGEAIGSGGTVGLLAIPPIAVGGYTFSPFELVPWFYLTLGISFLSLFIIYKVIHSSWGLGFVAIRESEPFAKSLGLDDYKYKLLVFGITSFLTGMMGAFYVHYVSVISTRMLAGLDLMLLLILIQVVGGMGRFPGAVIGSFVMTFTHMGLAATGVYRLVIFGAIIIAVILLAPDGIIGTLLPTSGLGPFQRFRRFIQRTFRR